MPPIATPASEMVPACGRYRPDTVRSSVVLPTPLRPRMVTSPALRERSTETVAQDRAAAESNDEPVDSEQAHGSSPEVGSVEPPASARIAAGTPVRDLAAAVEHDDAVADPHDHRHVVLDQQNRQTGVAQGAQAARRARRSSVSLRPAAGSSRSSRVGCNARERVRSRDASSGRTPGCRPGWSAKASRSKRPSAASAASAMASSRLRPSCGISVPSSEMPRWPMAPAETLSNTVMSGKMRRFWVRARDAEARNAPRIEPAIDRPLEFDVAASLRAMAPATQLNRGGLAGAVRADQTDQLAGGRRRSSRRRRARRPWKCFASPLTCSNRSLMARVAAAPMGCSACRGETAPAREPR